jgi:hypothetical protein
MHDITAGLRTDHTANIYSLHWARAVPVHAQSEAHKAEVRPFVQLFELF